MKEKLNIGEFNDSFMPVMDGVGNVVKNYAVELNKLNHKAYAIVPGYTEFPTFDKDNGIYYTIRGKEYYPLKSLRPYGINVFPNKTKRIINEIPFDIVHTHCPTFSAKLALQIAKRRDIPIISTFHTFFKDDLMELLPEKLANTVVKNGMKFYYKCDEVWTPSYASKRLELSKMVVIWLRQMMIMSSKHYVIKVIHYVILLLILLFLSMSVSIRMRRIFL